MNFYLTGIEGMPKLLDCCGDDPMKYFSKKAYGDAFQRMYQEHLETFDAIEQGYSTVIDKEQFLMNMADALTEYAGKKYDSCTKRTKRDHMMMDLNLTMAAFVLPMVLEVPRDIFGAAGCTDDSLVAAPFPEGSPESVGIHVHRGWLP